MAVITISCETGALGEQVGRKLAETVIAEIENRAREGEDLFGADRGGVIS